MNAHSSGTTGPHWTEASFVRRVLIVAGLAALGLVLWQLADVLLLVFGAALVAVILHAIADPIARGIKIGRPWALLVAVLLIAAVIGGTGYLFGAQIGAQVFFLFERLPSAFQGISRELGIGSLSELMQGTTIGNLAARAIAWSTTIFGAVASLVLVIAAGIYIAASPEIYREGLLKLFPPSQHARLRSTMLDAGEALRRWLSGQFMAMIIVGLMTGIGMWAIGLPSALALGLIAGLTEFIPYLGPILGAIPALLIASTQGSEAMLWALGVVVVVQQVENNIILPLIVGRAVAIPAAVGIFAVVALGVIFGPLGLLLGYPLAVVIDTAIRRLYVRDTLGEPVEIVAEESCLDRAPAK